MYCFLSQKFADQFRRKSFNQVSYGHLFFYKVRFLLLNFNLYDKNNWSKRKSSLYI